MTKIDLIFSTGYDSFVYKKDTNLFNKKFVGEMQLLAVLERELGLTGEFKTNKERQAEYLEYVTNSIKDKDVFISESFKNDAIGVTNELLRWRDELKLCNWNFQETGLSRLDFLAKIEKNYVVSPGLSDRWIIVLEELKNSRNIGINSIELNDDLNLLHPMFKKLFGDLEIHGVTIINKKISLNLDDNTNLSKVKKALLNGDLKLTLENEDNSFQVLQFKETITASDFLAQQLSKKTISPVIINGNNYGLDTSFLTFDIPLSGSKLNNANPQIVQIFKLISALLFTKVNPYNLLSLLNLPALPFSRSLARQLSVILIKNAGIENKDWFETIENFKKNINKEKHNWKEQLKAVEFYLERPRVDEVKKEDLLNIYRDLVTWAGTLYTLSENDVLKNQFYNLYVLSKSFTKTIENVSTLNFKPQELDRLTNKIYEPFTMTINQKEKDSFPVLKNPDQLYDNPDLLIWFDFYNCELSARFGDFLMQDEINQIKSQSSILFWEREHQIEHQMNTFKKAILKTERKLCVFISSQVYGTDTTKHPLHIQLASAITNFDDFVTEFDFKISSIKGWEQPQYTESLKINLPIKRDYINISNYKLLNKKLISSYSSLNELIQYPFDWTMNYQAKIKDSGISTIDELITLKGNLSHAVVQELLEKNSKGEIDLFKINIEEEIDNLLFQFTPKIALPFYLDENIIEYKVFVNQLKKSVKILLQIIENNNLIYNSHEYKVEGEINGLEFSGDIDLLFYKNKLPIIIDLKWTYSSSKYVTTLENEKQIQLAIYSKLLNDGNAISGYFLLSHGVLYTTFKELSGVGVNVIQLQENSLGVDDRVIEKAMNSLNFRWNELSEIGKIEMAEDISLESIDYSKETEEKTLIPLDGDGKSKKLNPYSNYELFKGLVK